MLRAWVGRPRLLRPLRISRVAGEELDRTKARGKGKAVVVRVGEVDFFDDLDERTLLRYDTTRTTCDTLTTLLYLSAYVRAMPHL